MNDFLNRPDWRMDTVSDSKLPLHNNVCFDTELHKKIKLLLADMDPKDVCHYTNEYNIYRLISEYYNMPIDNISIGLGSTELLNRIFFLFKKYNVTIISPTFEMVEVYCKLYSIKYNILSYVDFNKFNIDNIAHNTVVYVANPNGNNGHVFTVDEIKYIVNISKHVIIDEAYIDYSSTDTLLSLIELNNVTIVRTFSKSLGLAGIRCGFCFSNKKFIKSIQNIRLNCVSTGITSYLLESLIETLPDTITRMKDTRMYLESKYQAVESNGNYCLLVNCSDQFNFCKFKNVGDNIIRVTLADKQFFINEK